MIKQEQFGKFSEITTSSGSSIITILGSSFFLGFFGFLPFILDGEANGGGVLSLGTVTVAVDWLESEAC